MYTLPKLSYEYSSLEPYIDAKTMEIHHSKHHQGYVNNLNVALEKYPEFYELELEEFISKLNDLPAEIKTVVQNNLGGHYNHSLFWKLLTPQKSALPDGTFKMKLTEKFETLEKFQEQFAAKAMSVFGSGWAWLVEDKGELMIHRTSFQNNPLMKNPAVKILLGLDVWEHAYYLKHQNMRVNYIAEWWNVVNWVEVARRFDTDID